MYRFDADPEPDPTFRLEPDPDPDPDPTQVYRCWKIGHFVLTFIPNSARWFITSNISNCKLEFSVKHILVENDTDTDPDPPKLCRSDRIRIHNNGKNNSDQLIFH